MLHYLSQISYVYGSILYPQMDLRVYLFRTRSSDPEQLVLLAGVVPVEPISVVLN
jgi:hypothetical protein